MGNNHYYLPEKFNYAFAAFEEARNAALNANYGLRYRTAYERAKYTLQEWEKTMINASITLKTFLFLVFFFADIMVSWEMMKDVIDSGGLFSPPPTWAVLLLCLLINGWAAVSAHFIGQGWSKDIQEWERWNFLHITNRDQPLNHTVAILAREKRRARILAVVSSAILLIVVGLVIHHRLRVLAELQEVTFVNYIVTALPMAIILGELFTGDYIWYIIKRYQLVRKRRRNRKRFLLHKEKCGESDQLAYKHLQMAHARNETPEVIGDLERSMLRIRHRSQASDNYLEPFDRRIAFHFRSKVTGAAVPNLPVFGVLPNGAKTEDYSTNSAGKVMMQWEGEYDHIVAVHIPHYPPILGPFQANAEHYIDLAGLEPGEPVSIAPNGHTLVEPVEN